MIFPAALPQVLTAMQVALPIAFIVVIVAEMLTGGGGLGASMIEGARLANPVRVFEDLIVIGLFGFAFLWGCKWSGGRLLAVAPRSFAGAIMKSGTCDEPTCASPITTTSRFYTKLLKQKGGRDNEMNSLSVPRHPS